MNPYVLNHIPDAYDVTFTFKPLLPNNYNTYYAYILGDEGDDVKGIGTKITNLWENLTNSVNASLTQQQTNTTNAAKEQKN
jgi:hypothetical protein